MEVPEEIVLPLEQLEDIVIQFDLPELVKLCSNPNYHDICLDPVFWKRKLFEDFKIKSITTRPRQEYYVAYFNNLYSKIFDTRNEYYKNSSYQKLRAERTNIENDAKFVRGKLLTGLESINNKHHWEFLKEFLITQSSVTEGVKNLQILFTHPELGKETLRLARELKNLQKNRSYIITDIYKIRDEYETAANVLRNKAIELRKLLRVPKSWRLFVLDPPKKATNLLDYVREKIKNYVPRTLDIIKFTDESNYNLIINGAVHVLDPEKLLSYIDKIAGDAPKSVKDL